MALAYRPLYTYKDYYEWEGDWELIDGEAVAMAPSPLGPHQGVMGEIIYDIRNSLEECDENCYVYTELDYLLDEYTVFRPDVMVTCKKAIDFARARPEMIVEILSPSTAWKDRGVKFDRYEREGIPYYLIIDLELRVVEVYKLIDYSYKLIHKEQEEELILEIKGCKILLKPKRWWNVL